MPFPLSLFLVCPIPFRPSPIYVSSFMNVPSSAVSQKGPPTCVTSFINVPECSCVKKDEPYSPLFLRDHL